MRFPEFSGEWEKMKLGEIAGFSKGKGISKSEIDENGETECIRYGELYTHYGEVIAEIKSRTNISRKNLVFSEANDIIIPSSGETEIDIATASCVLKSGVALGGDLNIIKTSNNGVFLSYYLNSRKKLEIANLAQGISVVHLYASQLAILEVAIPDVKEQNCIADFLALLNDRISTQSKIIEGLRVLKTALSKKVFSQKLRFSEFADEWETKKLEELCSIKKGEQLNKNDLTEFGTYPCLNGGINPSGYTEKYNSDEDTITISEGGNSCGYVNYMKTKFWLGGHCYKVLLNENINRDYFYHLLKCNEQKIMNLRVGSGLPNIQQNALRNLELELCISFDEQQKIASFLSAIDKKIEIETVILNLLTKQKQCLLRQMFV